MSILAIPFHASKACPQGYVPAECSQCRSAIFVRSNTAEAPTCDPCRRALIEGEFGRITGDIRDIIKGNGEWEWASPIERNRFLCELRDIVLLHIKPDSVLPRVKPGEFPAGRFETPTAADICAMLDTEEEGVEVPEIFEQW